ncbi:flavodoxin [Vibrio rumoiensis]|uniref:flavodoxin n=1 Tax=Vibrio rumoiensis TaxID=76258 RepID=UPI000B5CE808|nr:flavodoxin [Vibrio rumoiensis]
MQFQIESYISDKNNWLSKQVDVEFPTPESLIGRQLYLASQQDITFTESNIESLLKTKGDLEVIEVDFHRLTILFSIIQASLWSDTPADERFIIEFLTQIILDDDYQLYLGFHEREPVSALICHIDQKNSLAVLSDITISKNWQSTFNEQGFVSDILSYLLSKSLIINKVIHPEWI